MFDTHKLNETGFEEVRKFKSIMAGSVSQALIFLPEGREKAIFLTKLEEAMFFGTKAIAGKSENHVEVTKY